MYVKLAMDCVRRSFIYFLFLLNIPCSVLSKDGKKANIVVFIADDMGYGDLGCYGNTSIRTPNIDGLARDGVRLTQNLATASVCTPSRAALLTGRHQMRSGMAPLYIMRVNVWLASRSGLPEEEVTFAELTKQAGYKNAMIGKWHLGVSRDRYKDYLHHPLNQGFDYFYGLLGTNMDDFGDDGTHVITMLNPAFVYQLLIIWYVVIISLWCLYKTSFTNTPTFLTLVLLHSSLCLYVYFITIHIYMLNSILYRNHEAVEQPVRLKGLSKRLVHEGVEFLNNATQEEKPFLLVMSWSHTHTALKVSNEFEGRSKFGVYGDAVEELDWSVGEILGHVDRLGARNNTLVYFVSDHGAHLELGHLGGFNGEFKGGKSHGAPDGAIRVPGIFRWPGVLPESKVIDEPVSLMDLFPLIAHASGSRVPDDRQIDGKDILPLLRGEADVSPHEFMYHYCGRHLHAVRYRPRTGKHIWKYVTHEPRYLPGERICRFICSCNDAIKLDPPLLYDIRVDPGEHYPINPDTDTYKHVEGRVKEAIRQHVESLEPVDSQFTMYRLLWRYTFQDCCNGTFPFHCSCSDSKFSPEMFT